MTKRQNPYTQIFKAQPSNPTHVPMTTMNLPRNDISATQEDKPSQSFIQNTPLNNLPPNNMFHSFNQTTQEPEATNTQTSDISSSCNEEDDDEDAPSFDIVRKKVKTVTLTATTELKSRRGSDFEEEKEQSEHSTTWETHSEANIIHETGDFLTSPPMNNHCMKDPSEFKLDQRESCSRNESVSTNPSVEENKTNNKKIMDFINQIGENLASCNFDPNSKQRIKCKMGHQWEMDLSTVAQGCPRCYDLLNECKEFARKNEGSCLNAEYEETIRYRCVKGHCWNLNHKNARRRWCAQCAKEQRAFLKKKCEEEKIEREKQEEESQKKLFEEARKKAMENNQTNGQPFGFSGMKAEAGPQRSMSLMEYFQRIDFEIESLAKKYTVQFMSQKEFKGDVSYQQILQVYKLLIMPEQVLQTYMFNLNDEGLKGEFRRMAKIIHPDKNKHPQAGNAFQKVYKVYEVALSRHEGNQQKI